MTSTKPSRRKKADHAPNSEVFRLLFANHPIPMWVYDLKTLAFLDVNDAALEKYGHTRDEFLALTIKDIRPVEDVACLINNLEQKRAALNHSGEWRHCLKNGQIIEVEVTTHTLDFEGHKATLVMAQDISERKRAEKSLQESEEKWRSLVTASPDYIALHDCEGRYLFLNHYAEGFTEKDVIGSSAFEYLAPESKDLFRKKMEECLNTLLVQKFEYSAMGNHGTLRTYEQYFVPIVSAKKETEILAIARDITERKQAEDVLKEYNARLETAVEARTSELRDAQEKLMRQEKLAMLGQLAGGVGHELRNPLAVINNAIYYLKLVGANGNEKVKEYLGIIETEAHTAEKIITDLLDFARIKSVDVEAVSALKLAEHVLERYPAPKVVRVRLELPEDLPMLYVDPCHIKQVLGNLVINACQAMSAGGELTITAQQEQGMIAMAVKDTGVGISPENMKKIFEPLFTTKAKGIGLGLAVSMKLAEANGGRIEVESEAGVGSTFTLVLPIHNR